jgi:anti-sigma factor RsiW
MTSIRRRLTHLITCKDASRLLSQMQDHRLSPTERLKLKLHLTACDACTKLERQLQFMRAALRKYRE